jgi:hypothetical protein
MKRIIFTCAAVALAATSFIFSGIELQHALLLTQLAVVFAVLAAAWKDK